MKERIMEELLLRTDLKGKEIQLNVFLEDSMAEMRGYLNLDEDEEIPEGCRAAVKELTMLRFHQDGVEGIQSESQSFGGSATYLDDFPQRIKKTICRYRRMKR